MMNKLAIVVVLLASFATFVIAWDCSVTDTIVADSSFSDVNTTWDSVNNYCWNISNNGIWVRTTNDTKFLGLNNTPGVPAILVKGYDNVKIQHMEFYDWDIGVLLIDSKNVTLDALYFHNNSIAIKMVNSSVNMLSDVVINNTNDGIGFWLENMTTDYMTNAYSDTLGPNYCYGACSTYNYTMYYDPYIKADYPYVFVNINNSTFDGDYITVENNVIGANFTRTNETWFRDFTFNSTVAPIVIDSLSDSNRIRYNTLGGSNISAESERTYPMKNNWCPYNTYVGGILGPNCNDLPIENLAVPNYSETEDASFSINDDLWDNFWDADTLDADMTYQILSQNTSIATCSINGNRYFNCTQPVQDACGVINVTLNVTDDDSWQPLSTQADFMINVSCVNDAPNLTQKSPSASADENISYTYQFNATDIDSGTLNWAVNDTRLSIDANGLLNWTPTYADVGTNNIKVYVNDSELNDSYSWTITVTCTDSDSDSICDTPENDVCVGQTVANVPADTDCAYYSFNATTGCHDVAYNASGTIINTYNCDAQDTSCADYNNVSDTCDGSGNLVTASCGDNITYNASGTVVDQTACDHLDTDCTDYTPVNNTCDGSGNIVPGTCGSEFTYQPNGFVVEIRNCDVNDTVCADFHNISDTCDGAGNRVNAVCGDNITYQSNGYVTNTDDCDYLDTSCRDYDDVNDVCDGAGNVIDNSCTVYTDQPNGFVVDTTNCDHLDESCTDYTPVDNTCDGAGNYVAGTCGSEFTYVPVDTVINTDDCDYLDSSCRNYDDVDDVCDGSGNLIDNSCTVYTDEPITTQCGSDTTYYSCNAGNSLDDDVYSRLYDQHCDGLGACTETKGSWQVQAACTNEEFCDGAGNSTNSNDYSCQPCLDLDSDGVCDAYDSCLATPGGEGVNTLGCSCSQVTIDDGEYCTDDSCVDGVVTHTNNNLQSPAITDCPEDICNLGDWVDYPADGYAVCSGGSLQTYSCAPSRAYRTSCDFDLDAYRLRLDSWSSTTANNPTWFTFTLKNRGLQPTVAEYEVDFGDSSSVRQERISLEPDEKTTIFVKHTYASADTYTVTVTADPDDDLSETNENNDDTLEVTIQ